METYVVSGHSNAAALIGQFYAERNREYPLRVPVLSVGRSSANSIRIRDQRIAAEHVRIAREDSRYVLEVRADGAPTALNGRPLQRGERKSLVDGDIISLADLTFRFVNGPMPSVHGRLWVVAGVHRGKIFRIDSLRARVGRAADNDIQFPDRSVSRHHCRLSLDGSGWWIEDLESTNGTYTQGMPILERTQLSHGDEIIAGFSRFVFQEAQRPLENLKLEPIPPCN